MRVVVIGATGTIGMAVAEALAAKYEVVRVGHTSGDHRVDLASRGDIERLLGELGEFDHLVSAAGDARFRPLTELSDDDFAASLGNKLMGQVNLARLGLSRVRDGGSITLTSGVLAQHPMPGSAAISLVNAGLEGFVRAAALEMPRGVRINVVSPPWIKETLVKLGMDPGPGLSAADCAKAYVEAVEGSASGTTIDARRFA